MRYSQLFGKTVRSAPSDAVTVSHKLLFQGGFVRESTAGHYYFLPLGMRVYTKIVKIIKEEMDRAGAQELQAPVMHPLELWKETNRNKETGFELTVVEDRRGAQFALGGTAEEMMVDLVRKFQLTYRDLPFNIYQFSQKFRDELRARGGLLRVREFMMKDAYSFHKDEKDFKREYKKMRDTYSTIFKRLGLSTVVVESDNGYIGGEYCHEFVVESDIGESKFLATSDGTYLAHEDVALFKRELVNVSEGEKPLEIVRQPEWVQTMDDNIKHYKVPKSRFLKNVVYKNRVTGEVIIAVIRGDLDVNKVKLEHVLGTTGQLDDATEEDLKKIGTRRGYVHSWGHKGAKYVGDLSLKSVHNFIGGQKEKNTDSMNVNYGRDFVCEKLADIALAKAGYMTIDGKHKLIEKKGIEVGNIFQLGYHYSDKMKKATYIDEAGKPQKFYMGCYGIGVGRTMAAIVEKYNDERGIVWPRNMAPFSAYLISLGKDPALQDKADKLYVMLIEKGVDVLFDDRIEASAGVKFADFDLIGVPIRLVISERTGDKIEVKMRDEKETKLVNAHEVIGLVAAGR